MRYSFVVILYYLYKLCLKLQHQVIPEEGEALVGRVGFVSIPNELPNSHSILLIEINGMLQELPAYPEDSNKSLKGGQRVRISKFENGKYYFN